LSNGTHVTHFEGTETILADGTWDSCATPAYSVVMADPPPLDRWDYAAGTSVLGLLVFAYVIYPNTLVQYGVWLTVFTIWMAWFVFYGVKWVYPEDQQG